MEGGKHVSMKPEEISTADLPSALRGYQREATDELIKRIAWEYRRLAHSESSLAEQVRLLSQEKTSAESVASDLREALATTVLQPVLQPSHEQSPQVAASANGVEAPVAERSAADAERIAELERHVSALSQAVDEHRATVERHAATIAEQNATIASRDAAIAERDVAIGQHRETIDRQHAQLEHYASRDELPRELIANAQRSARALRESTLADCHAALKKARRRAQEIERDARAGVSRSSAEIDRLRRMQNDLRDQLRRTLQTVLDDGERSPAAVPPDVAPRDPGSL